jgi:hypothetical protein
LSRAFGASVLRPREEGGRIKVVDEMVWVNVVPPDGVPRRMSGMPGESLLHVLKRHRVPGIFPDCDGGDKENSMMPYQVPYDWYSMGVSCAQCSVHIPDPWFEKLNKMPSTEEKRLTTRVTPNSQFSRLACCIQIRPELNEMIVVIGNNKSINGDWFTGDDADAM